MLRDLARALCLMGSLLGTDHADYCFEGRFRFGLTDEWSLVISPDDAGRFRLDACWMSRRVATLWCRADDLDRLEALVLGAAHEVAALAALPGG